MEYVELQGEKVPRIGLGTWQLTGRQCRDAVKNALDIGYRHVDTAQVYGNERQVGQGIQASKVDRDDVWLTTKVWRDKFRREDVISSAEESLRKLGTDYVNLLLIHWPSENVPFRETLDAMNQLVEEGKVRNIGVSNFTPEQLEKARKISDAPLLTNQVEYHPFLDQEELLEVCRNEDMMLTAYSPLARGDVLENEVLNAIGARHDKSPAQVALRWLMQQENVAAIPKASGHEHQADNLNVFDFQLSDEEMEQISGLEEEGRKVDPAFAPWNR
ncbi:MAG: aldo/keto reductase [Candidatus Nanohaloarchaea archaeon]